MPPRKLRPGPDLTFESAFGAGRIVCGIDEVGRGPLAGPVTAAAVILPSQGLPPDLAAAINDSKLLSPEVRIALEPEIRNHAVAFAVAEANVDEIDRLNILHAALLAMKRAFEALAVRPDAALVDGKIAPDLPCAVQCVVKGDSLSQSIAAASILAKVARDRVMERLAEDFPQYGWDRNAGYPTPEHKAALQTHGVTPHHRRSFAPVRQQLAISR